MRVIQLLVILGASGFLPVRGHPGHEGNLETAAGSPSNLPSPQVSISTEGNERVIRANGVPNHEIGQFPGPGCPNAVSAQNYTLRVPLNPKTNASFTQLKQQAIGVALNGVPFDPGTAEYWKNDRTSGWHIEALGGRKSLGFFGRQAPRYATRKSGHSSNTPPFPDQKALRSAPPRSPAALTG